MSRVRRLLSVVVAAAMMSALTPTTAHAADIGRYVGEAYTQEYFPGGDWVGIYAYMNIDYTNAAVRPYGEMWKGDSPECWRGQGCFLFENLKLVDEGYPVTDAFLTAQNRPDLVGYTNVHYCGGGGGYRSQVKQWYADNPFGESLGGSFNSGLARTSCRR